MEAPLQAPSLQASDSGGYRGRATKLGAIFRSSCTLNDQNDDFSHESEILSERQHSPAMNLDASVDFISCESIPVEVDSHIYTQRNTPSPWPFLAIKEVDMSGSAIAVCQKADFAIR